MSDFCSVTVINHTRVRHKCASCQQGIEIGDSAHLTVASVDGDFCSYYEHPECRAAAHAYQGLVANYGDEWNWLHAIDEVSDWEWLIKEHPIAAARLGAKERIERRKAA